jgi:hypothetical protein
MVQVMKHEWHQVDSQFLADIDVDLLMEIYPDLKKTEAKKLLKELENGEADLEQIIQDACDEGVEIEWDRDYDDWWTERKGGYEVTFEVVS